MRTIPYFPNAKRNVYAPLLCETPACGETARYSKYGRRCNKCHQRIKRHGDPHTLLVPKRSY